MPLTATVQTIGAFTTSDVGITNEMVRFAPTARTAVDSTSTAPPLPAGGVMVTVTLVLGIAPAGKFFPATVTVLPAEADVGVVAVLSTTCPEAAAVIPANAINPAILLKIDTRMAISSGKSDTEGARRDAGAKTPVPNGEFERLKRGY